MTRILASRGLGCADGKWERWRGHNSAGPQASPTPAIRDIRPPLDVFPYPIWMVLTAGRIALLLLALMAASLCARCGAGRKRRRRRRGRSR